MPDKQLQATLAILKLKTLWTEMSLLQLSDSEGRLDGAEKEKSSTLRDMAHLKSELTRLRAQLDHTSDSQVWNRCASCDMQQSILSQ